MWLYLFANNADILLPKTLISSFVVVALNIDIQLKFSSSIQESK